MNVRDLHYAAESATAATIPLLQQFVSIASVSARGELLEAGAEHCAGLLRDAGLQATLWHERGAPVVFGHQPAPPGAPTILFYGHYDVQPAEPLDQWLTPPFEGVLRDGAVYGRGAGDNKGQLLAHIGAVRALREAGRLGVGVKFLVEGEEEIGSPNLGAVTRQHRSELHADVAITSDAPVHDDGNPVIIFGVRGLLYVQLDIGRPAADLHSGNRGGLAPTPAWELVHALATLRRPDGRVAIPGFYDQVRAATDTEKEMLRRLPFDRQRMLAQLEIKRFPGDADADPWGALMFQPALNISGLTGGYAGPGAKTVIPGEASCKLDVRLVADQDPTAVLDNLSRHLADVAPGIRVQTIASVPPSATEPTTPIAAPIIEAVHRASGHPPWLRPRLGGTTPDYVFTEVLGIPSLLIPFGPPDMNHHAANEKMTVQALRRGIRCSLAICEQLASQPRAKVRAD